MAATSAAATGVRAPNEAELVMPLAAVSLPESVVPAPPELVAVSLLPESVAGSLLPEHSSSPSAHSAMACAAKAALTSAKRRSGAARKTSSKRRARVWPSRVVAMLPARASIWSSGMGAATKALYSAKASTKRQGPIVTLPAAGSAASAAAAVLLAMISPTLASQTVPSVMTVECTRRWRTRTTGWPSRMRLPSFCTWAFTSSANASAVAPLTATYSTSAAARHSASVPFASLQVAQASAAARFSPSALTAA
mmetsp:Transcript_115313/g.372634  ORF Transcript_115313/g.372634 Transcript_115313/m.372634 type:complete len:252 (+) Transcript_115313:448-1203(+)